MLYKNENNCCCRESSETNSHVLLANPHSHWPHLEPPRPQALSVSSQAGCDVTQLAPDIDLYIP